MRAASRRIIIVGLVLTALVAGGAATAQEQAAMADSKDGESGRGLYVSTVIDIIDQPDGTQLMRTRDTGFVTSENSDSPIHLANSTCTGSFVVSVDRESRTGAGSCDIIDKDGDVMLISWRGTREGGEWNIDGGTGKWETTQGGGQWKAGRLWSDGKYSNTWTGSWRSSSTAWRR